MNASLKKVVQYIVFTSIGVFLFWLSAREASFDELVHDIKNANLHFIIYSLIAGLVAYLSRAIRWRILIEPLGHSPRLIHTFSTLMIGYLANFLFPRIGEVTRCGMLSKKEKIPFDRLIGTVILERAFDLVMLIFFLIVLFIANYNLFGRFFAQKLKAYMFDNVNLFILPIILITLLVLTLVILRPLYKRYKIRILRNKQVRKLYSGMKGVILGVKTIMRLKKSHWFIFHTLVIWVSYFFMTYFMLFALKSTSGLTPVDGLFLMVMGGIGMSIPVQGGIGSFHALITISLGLYDIAYHQAFTFATLLHESHAIFSILLGLLSLIVFYISRTKKTTEI